MFGSRRARLEAYVEGLVFGLEGRRIGMEVRGRRRADAYRDGRSRGEQIRARIIDEAKAPF